jgi:hypothetical protein
VVLFISSLHHCPAFWLHTQDVLWLVFRDALWLVLIDIVIGGPAAVAATRLISSQLFGVKGSDLMASLTRSKAAWLSPGRSFAIPED